MGLRTVVKKLIPKKLFRRIEPYGHLGEAVLFNTLNGFPASGLKVIGVTGTNGKTSTCFLIHRMMVEAGYNVGLMTTVGYGVGNNIRPQIHHMTNVTVPELMRRLKWFKREGAEWLVLETTSHALAQNRVWGMPYSIAVMTNVTHEHLDYHNTFKNYRDAKRQLFKIANRNKKGLRAGVINAEDPSAELFISDIAKPITYGIKKGDMRAKDIKMTPSGSNFTVALQGSALLQGRALQVRTNLPGSFNVYNTLAAVGVGMVLGLEPKQIEQGIAALDSVEGRMTSIDEGQDFGVVVDYAHTPDSFEKLFKDLREVMKGSRASHLDAVQGSSEERVSHADGTVSERQSVTDTAMRQESAGTAGSAGRQGKAMRGSGKLIVMFGSAGGQRDKLKRPVQGELAGKYADEVVLTEEDDRDTPGVEILDSIAAGVEKAGKVRDKDLFLVHDRTEAIKFSLSRAQKGDTVLLLGKGHEKTIERADGEHPWDEIGITKAALRQSLKK
ncbi:UDP-N-acetylmuramyl-tripeptide synthetase [Candidatus Saccharibacteria bacterium]|nr:UDP-N-acetylmuramyl-tripeptide synthetase [Candidatus Saccharibacteria bacterium]